MIPIVFVLVYKLEKCIQHINKKEILSYLQRQLMFKKTHLRHKKNVASGTFFIGPVKRNKISILNGLKMHSVSNHKGKIP